MQDSARVAGGRSGFQLAPTHPEPSVAAAPRGHTCATSERVDRVGGFLVMVADPLTSAPEVRIIGRRSRPLWHLFSETPLSTLFFASDRIPASAVPIWCIYHRQKASIATIEGVDTAHFSTGAEVAAESTGSEASFTRLNADSVSGRAVGRLRHAGRRFWGLRAGQDTP